MQSVSIIPVAESKVGPLSGRSSLSHCFRIAFALNRQRRPRRAALLRDSARTSLDTVVRYDAGAGPQCRAPCRASGTMWVRVYCRGGSPHTR